MTPSGRVVWVHDQNSLVSDQNGRAQCLQGVLNDITARKQAETEKVELEEQLRQAQKMEAIGTLAGGIAHDFNNILGVIFGCVELAIEERQDPSQLESHLDETLKAAERARNLVKQILTFGRQSDPRPKPIHLEAIIGEAMNLFRASLPATIEIRQDISNSGLLLGDPIQVQQIIMNLCTNAGHAMRETGGRLTVVLEDVELDEEKLGHLPELAPGPYLRLTVKDTGDGMDRATLKRIFDPYFTTKGPKEGTGLGLAVVHGIVQALHGAITVEAAPGQGATFEVYLPRMADPPASGLNPPLPAKVPEERRGLQERILFVDDEELLARVGSRLLQSMGYEVTATTSSVEALNLFCRNPDGFDLVVTDQTMPLMTGDQLAREMLGLRRDLPVILCTGFSDLINEEGAKKLGIREFLLKPIRSPDLAKIVRRVLDEPRP